MHGQEVRTPLQDISEDKYGCKSMIGSDSSHRGKWQHAYGFPVESNLHIVINKETHPFFEATEKSIYWVCWLEKN